eukprot:2526998-Amphidinium_carterae.1
MRRQCATCLFEIPVLWQWQVPFHQRSGVCPHTSNPVVSGNMKRVHRFQDFTFPASCAMLMLHHAFKVEYVHIFHKYVELSRPVRFGAIPADGYDRFRSAHITPAWSACYGACELTSNPGSQLLKYVVPTQSQLAAYKPQALAA